MTADGSTTKPIDESLVEWREVWLENLEWQIFELHHRREIHDEFMAVLEAQTHSDSSTFAEAFHGMYLESQVMAIRRLADDDSRTISLRRLIGQIEQRRRDFTRKWYVERWMDGIDPAIGFSSKDGKRGVRQVHGPTR